MSTPHISAKENEIADVVFMPGDPLRAQKYAEMFLKPGYKLVSSVRNMFAFTGETKDQGNRITIMGHGMGLASSGIYAYELFKFYNVKRIVRLGTAALHNQKVKMFDIVVGKNLVSNNNFATKYGFEKGTVITPKSYLLDLIKKNEASVSSQIHYGTIISSDWFYYGDNKDNDKNWQIIAKTYNSDAKEMEGYGIEAIAQFLGKESLTIVTCVHNIFTSETTDSEVREKKVNEMATLAINSLQKV